MLRCKVVGVRVETGGGLKEKRPLLYKISCVSKGLTSSLPVVVIEAKLAECVAVVVKYGVGVEGWVGG